MKANETAPALISVMSRILKCYISNKTDDLDEWDFENEHNKTHLYSLVAAQGEIGWDSVFKGRISIEWRNIQNSYLRATEQDVENPRPGYRTATYWASGLIQQVIYLTLNTWQI